MRSIETAQHQHGSSTKSDAEPGISVQGNPIRSSRVWRSLSAKFPGLGEEFMPDLDEGSFLFMPTTMPHASITEARDVLKHQDMAIGAVPEVESVVGKLGRVESALDPAPISMFETVITYKPEYKTNPETGKPLVAKGVVAIGNIAFGVVSIGVAAFGIVTLAAFGLGVVSLAALAIGVIALGPMAFGYTFALGVVAISAEHAVGIFASGKVLSIGLVEFLSQLE